MLLSVCVFVFVFSPPKERYDQPVVMEHGQSQVTQTPLLPTFPASSAARGCHVTQLWPMMPTVSCGEEGGVAA